MPGRNLSSSESNAFPCRVSAGATFRNLFAGLLFLAFSAPAAADPVADFYKGKVVRVLIGSAAGGEYDVLGRLVGRHIGKHIPGNPNVLAVNMPGAFALNMANHLYLNAERNGTTIGTINNGLPLMEAVGGDGVRFKAAEFQWIGSTSPVTPMIVAWRTKGVRTIDDARSIELVVGAMGRGNLTYAVPALMNDLIGTKFKIAVGYRGGSEIDLAMERGEVDARMSSLRSIKENWLREGRINFLAQAGARATDKELQSLPMIEDLTATRRTAQSSTLSCPATRWAGPSRRHQVFQYARI